MSDAQRGARPRRRRGFGAAWLALLAACVLVVGATEVVLLQLSASYFTGGFNGVAIRGIPQLASFLVGSILQDAWLVLALWLIVVPFATRLGLSALRVFVLAGATALAVPLLTDFVRKRLHYVLGDLTGFGSLWELAGPDLPSTVVEAVTYLPPLGIPIAMGTLGLLAVLGATSLVERRVSAGRFAPPRTRALLAGFVLLGAVGLLVLRVPGDAASRVQFGLLDKPSGIVLARLGNAITDLDRDGFGALSKLRDPAPFDASIFPYAVDRPGDGIDQNGLAGDHPPGFELPRPAPPPPVDSQRDVLLIFLESFRGDLIGRRFQGREVTPFLNRLAREGAHSERAQVHTPATATSRAQLFSGRLTPRPGEPTLIDDFKAGGYLVAHFSGQNDSYANSEALLGVARADRFYDARQDADRRTSRSTSPVGLQVSWKTLNERVLAFLEEQDPERPLFLYVNIVDTHFPYTHREVDRIFDVEPLAQHEIRADRADEVWATYLNTAANVDRAIEQLVERWWSLRGRDGVILVTADHGQSLYDDERGYLGHGRSLRSAQARVPLIVWGLGGEWPEPLGLADVRALLLRHLAADEPPPARFVPDPERLVFGFAPRIERPRLLGLRSLERMVLYDFDEARVEILDGDERPLPLPPEQQRASFEQLIHHWEALRLADAARGAS
jgi:hypothetical protein